MSFCLYPVPAGFKFLCSNLSPQPQNPRHRSRFLALVPRKPPPLFSQISESVRQKSVFSPLQGIRSAFKLGYFPHRILDSEIRVFVASNGVEQQQPIEGPSPLGNPGMASPAAGQPSHLRPHSLPQASGFSLSKARAGTDQMVLLPAGRWWCRGVGLGGGGGVLRAVGGEDGGPWWRWRITRRAEQTWPLRPSSKSRLQDMEVENGGGAGPVESRPGVFVIGSPNVGKRTLLSRLLSIDFPDTCDLSSGILCQGWTIDTKYYSADLSIWTAHLDDGFSFGALPNLKQLAALVMVFDMSDGSSFLALQNWVLKIDIKSFEILLCIGNKADLVPGHYAHREYRRRMQKHGESTSDPHPEYLDYGIDETEGCSLLEDEEPSLDIRKSCLEWCCQNNIEYIEACSSNADFDKCLSVDGDIQGVERLYGALSAHMWPGMTLKSGNRITIPSLVDKAETTDDESDYDFEYEVLSHGSDEPWDNTGDLGVTGKKGFVSEVNQFVKDEMVDGRGSRVDISTSGIAVGGSSVSPSDLASESVTEDRPDTENKTNEHQDQKDKRETSADQAPASEVERQVELEDNAPNGILDEDALYGLDDLERLMSEIGNMRENLRLMPDFQRRETAAKLAMKMAAMFGDSGDEDGL